MWIWVNTVFTLISLKTEIARSARGPKLQGPRAEDAVAEPYLVQKTLVIWLQQITRFSVKVVNLETIIDMQSWCRTWPPNGSSRIRAKQKLLNKHKGGFKSSWSRTGSLKSFTLTIPWNFAKLVKIFPGIIVRRHHTDRETNGITERAMRRVKEGTSAVLLQSGLDENWWADSMEYHTYLRNIQDLLSDGKTPYERRFGKPFKGPIIPFGSLVEYYLISAKDQSRIHQFGKKVLPGLFLGYALYAEGIWKGDIMVADIEELETMDASEIYSKKDSMQRKWYFPKKMENLFFQPQMDESNFLEEIRNWEHPPWYGNTQFEEKVKVDFLGESEGSPPPPPQDSLLDASEATNDFWSMSGNFKNRHHVEPRVKLYSPREESFPIPLKHWRLQNCKDEFGCYARKTHRWLLEYRWIKRFVWSLDRFHTIYSIGRTNLQKDICGPRRDWQNGR